ncbi:MAG: serine/threonine protein kinase, partial [Gemmataceae bacterium]
MNLSQCPLDDTLARYATGNLDDTLADGVDDHLAHCGTCLARLDSVRQPISILVQSTDSSHQRPAALYNAIKSVMALFAVEEAASQIGDYRIVRPLGRGGMGQVLLAQHPRLNLQVAVKLLRTGLDDERLRMRFTTEHELLAKLDHPHIAKVFDAGLSADDRPYFVMEYVPGRTLTQHLTTESPTLIDRLQLFGQLCRAVQHAHQNAIIHRDIKPSNVLVTKVNDSWVPKLIDFGIARGVDMEKSQYTEPGYIVGTLAYMSPEQTQDSSACLDTRTDVYSLGVLLYVLLTGKPPLAWQSNAEKSEWELLRLVRETESDPASLHANVAYPNSRVQNELDWIAFKALEKEPNRRYPSAEALAEDIERVLHDEPVSAAPPSRVYRLRKFVRRNRAIVIGSSLLGLSLLAGIVATTVQLQRARAAELESAIKKSDAEEAATRAGRERDAANELLQFITKDILELTNLEAQLAAGFQPDRQLRLRTVLDRAAAKIDTRFVGQPQLEARIRTTIGIAYAETEGFAEANQHLSRAHELVQSSFPDSDRIKVELLRDIGIGFSTCQNYSKAHSIADQGLRIATASHPDDHHLRLRMRIHHASLESISNVAPEFLAEVDQILTDCLKIEGLNSIQTHTMQS